MAKIYNEVVWFDDPMHEMKDYSQYPKLNLDQTIVKCVEYLKTGFDGIDGNHTMPWTEWIASDSSLSAGDYTYWDLMTPEYFALAAELALWQGRWQDVIDLILPKMNEAFASASVTPNGCARPTTTTLIQKCSEEIILMDKRQFQ